MQQRVLGKGAGCVAASAPLLIGWMAGQQACCAAKVAGCVAAGWLGGGQQACAGWQLAGWLAGCYYVLRRLPFLWAKPALALMSPLQAHALRGAAAEASACPRGEVQDTRGVGRIPVTCYARRRALTPCAVLPFARRPSSGSCAAPLRHAVRRAAPGSPRRWPHSRPPNHHHIYSRTLMLQVRYDAPEAALRQVAALWAAQPHIDSSRARDLLYVVAATAEVRRL